MESRGLCNGLAGVFLGRHTVSVYVDRMGKQKHCCASLTLITIDGGEKASLTRRFR